jgi:hypothetical protein
MTRDIDILGRAFPGEEAEIIRRVSIIAGTEIDDGVTFGPGTLKTMPIREEDEYGGLRLTMVAGIARARLKLQLDVSLGDPITPEPQTINYPQKLAAEHFQLLSYPLATVVAEKLSTAISLGDLNTRDRDYADLYRLLSLNDLDGKELTTALAATTTHRSIALRPLSAAITDLAERRQFSYTAWRRRQESEAAHYPESFTAVVELVRSFADPLVTGQASAQHWNASQSAWS